MIAPTLVGLPPRHRRSGRIDSSSNDDRAPVIELPRVIAEVSIDGDERPNKRRKQRHPRRFDLGLVRADHDVVLETHAGSEWDVKPCFQPDALEAVLEVKSTSGRRIESSGGARLPRWAPLDLWKLLDATRLLGAHGFAGLLFVDRGLRFDGSTTQTPRRRLRLFRFAPPSPDVKEFHWNPRKQTRAAPWPLTDHCFSWHFGRNAAPKGACSLDFHRADANAVPKPGHIALWAYAVTADASADDGGFAPAAMKPFRWDVRVAP